MKKARTCVRLLAGPWARPAFLARRSRTAGKAAGPSWRVRRSAAEPLPRQLKLFLVVLTLFMLGNSTDAFLLLKLTESPAASSRTAHVVRAARREGDRVDRRRQLV